MPEFTTLLLFAAASFALIIVPGPAVLYIITRSLDQGRNAGLASVAGVSIGAYVQILAAALGLSAILASSTLAFALVKYAGAAYLIYLGLQKLLSKPNLTTNVDVEKQPLRKIFKEGIIVNILNPKSALFFFAFLPQFVDPLIGGTSTQILILGAVFVVVALLSDSAYALLASGLGTWLKQNRTFLRLQHYFSGSIYLLMGVGAALGSSSQHK